MRVGASRVEKVSYESVPSTLLLADVKLSSHRDALDGHRGDGIEHTRGGAASHQQSHIHCARGLLIDASANGLDVEGYPPSSIPIAT